MKTRDEVIKAIEICVKRTSECKDCPYWELTGKSPTACFDAMALDALRLIKGEDE